MRRSEQIAISTARFANVAFSDGSLLHGFNQRLQKHQPIVAPNDIRRYFVTPEESGELCLMSCIFGDNRDIFFPKLSESLHLVSFADIAVSYLRQRGYEALVCKNEEEARALAKVPPEGKWPCLFTTSDTTGEKDIEEFFTANEQLDMQRFEHLGIIKNDLDYVSETLLMFEREIDRMKAELSWTKDDLVALFHQILPDFGHRETGKYLDGKM